MQVSLPISIGLDFNLTFNLLDTIVLSSVAVECILLILEFCGVVKAL